MNNEIKEINIKIPGQILDYVDTKEHLLDLFNYITNLQQENERLKETLEEHDETLEKTFNLVAQLTLRIDKAIEYIKERIEEFKNGGKSRKEIKAHQYYMLLCDIERILNSSL